LCLSPDVSGSGRLGRPKAFLKLIAHQELTRYLNAEKRRPVQIVENLWDKYAVSSRELEKERDETLKVLDAFLQVPGYIKEGI